MSFSLKWLFALVAVAALFTAALIDRTSLWAFVAVNFLIFAVVECIISLGESKSGRHVVLHRWETYGESQDERPPDPLQG